MEKVQARYIQKPATVRSLYFSDSEKMRMALLKDLNETQEKMYGDYLGGIQFEEFSLDRKKLKYKIMFPRRMEKRWFLNEFWSEDGPYSAVADLNHIPGEPPYWSSGFLSIQFAIESSFLEVSIVTIIFYI